MDVRLSADRVPFLLHDATLERTTDGEGPAAEHRWAEIRSLRGAGGGPPPALSEALDLAASLDLGLNLELKPEPGRATALAGAVAAELGSRDSPRVLLSSFDPEILRAVRPLLPAFPLGILQERPAGWQELARELRVFSLNPAAAAVTPGLAAEVHAAGLRLLVWTVNEADLARRLFAWGADALFTDDPELPRRVPGPGAAPPPGAAPHS